jgi:hypothetical protein
VPELVTLLEELGNDALEKLTSAVSLKALKEVLDVWRANQSNDDEQFWQALLAARIDWLFFWLKANELLSNSS